MNRQNNLPSTRKNIFSDFFDLYAREFFDPMMGEENAETFSPKVEVKETEKGYSVRAELPGVSEEDISLSLDDNCLILQGEKKEESSSEDKKQFRSEFSYGSFYRTIPFRFDVDNNRIEATFKNGILHVSLLKKEDGTEKSKKIKINH
ncbi:MAG: Hsp20/alpha crystallin family protein [Bdellovibrionota bacterium]